MRDSNHVTKLRLSGSDSLRSLGQTGRQTPHRPEKTEPPSAKAGRPLRRTRPMILIAWSFAGLRAASRAADQEAGTGD